MEALTPPSSVESRDVAATLAEIDRWLEVQPPVVLSSTTSWRAAWTRIRWLRDRLAEVERDRVRERQVHTDADDSNIGVGGLAVDMGQYRLLKYCETCGALDVPVDPPDPATVERVKRAISDVLGGSMDDCAVQADNGEELFTEAARAALAAMRAPESR